MDCEKRIAYIFEFYRKNKEYVILNTHYFTQELLHYEKTKDTIFSSENDENSSFLVRPNAAFGRDHLVSLPIPHQNADFVRRAEAVLPLARHQVLLLQNCRQLDGDEDWRECNGIGRLVAQTVSPKTRALALHRLC